MASAKETEDQAIGWLAERETDHWTREREEALANWLNASTANRVAFLRVSRIWSIADHVHDVPAPVTGRDGTIVRAFALMAATLVFALLCGGAWLLWAPDPRIEKSEYATAIGESRKVTLADGTGLELNTATHVTALIGDERRLFLERGEIFLGVAHDADRPFLIDTEQGRISVIGTQFNVRSVAGRLRVSVLEGGVRIQTADEAGVIARPGDIYTADAQGWSMNHASAESAADEAAWREGWLIFRDRRLEEVADEFNRYNASQISVSSASLREFRISGRFAFTNVEAFARIAAKLSGGAVESRPGKIILSAR